MKPMLIQVPPRRRRILDDRCRKCEGDQGHPNVLGATDYHIMCSFLYIIIIMYHKFLSRLHRHQALLSGFGGISSSAIEPPGSSSLNVVISSLNF
jgi:hypothetical protein